jgi:predicted small lipoprotein YifL
MNKTFRSAIASMVAVLLFALAGCQPSGLAPTLSAPATATNAPLRMMRKPEKR